MKVIPAQGQHLHSEGGVKALRENTCGHDGIATGSRSRDQRKPVDIEVEQRLTADHCLGHGCHGGSGHNQRLSRELEMDLATSTHTQRQRQRQRELRKVSGVGVGHRIASAKETSSRLGGQATRPFPRLHTWKLHSSSTGSFTLPEGSVAVYTTDGQGHTDTLLAPRPGPARYVPRHPRRSPEPASPRRQR